MYKSAHPGEKLCAFNGSCPVSSRRSSACAACSKKAEPPKQAAATKTAALGIHPYGTGDPNFKPDYSKLPPELQKTFTYIDDHIDEHAENMQKWIKQPSISNSGEGIPESAEMVKGFFEELGCQDARVYDTGRPSTAARATRWSTRKCDEGAQKTVAIYWQYDTMPITQPDMWVVPPFEGRVVDGQRRSCRVPRA